ncbi:MAG: superoxide dismutase, partial [Pseudomonadales bacterium]|nr:superoxide dismutase [Pseudomonadales bacterium]
LEEVVRKSSGGTFNNAAQVWNHTFYWNSMSPSGGGLPGKTLAGKLAADFGSVDSFIEKFSDAAKGQFGSGWAWLVQRQDGSLAITTTGDADTPLTGSDTPLLTCDVWEHAYYIDRRNDRGAYLDAWWNVVNWKFAEANLA